MKRSFFLSFSVLLFFSITKAQSPQFAVVRPDGTTYICPTLDSAYNKAVNDDFIYLPGGSFNFSNPINKRLQIFGAGSDVDSSITTGPTIISNCIIESNASNGLIEGIKLNTAVIFNGTSPVSNYTISKCYINGGIGFAGNVTIDMCTIKDCYIGSSSTGGSGSFSFWGNGMMNNSTCYNSIITSYFNVGGTGNLFSNNLFFFAQQFAYVYLSSNSTYNNNYFQYGMQTATSNSIFNNNMNGSPAGSSNITYNRIDEPADSSFINPGPISPYGWIYYDKSNNYHLRPTSLGKNTGTDGFDRGNYGGPFPWTEGLIPSNPHIYFRQVSPTTNSTGQLPVEFKVRTGN